nr:hypothetical protein pPsy0479b_00066 [Pseudomonas syringae]
MQDLSFSTIENHLGPAKDRFFGDGFKHVSIVLDMLILLKVQRTQV